MDRADARSIAGRPLRLVLFILFAGVALAGCGPRPVEVSREIGEFNFRHRNYEVAAQHFGDIIARFPGDGMAQFRYGQSMLELGELTAARRALEIASAEMPNNDAVLDALAETLAQQGDDARLFQLLRDRAAVTGTAESWIRISEFALRFDDPDLAYSAAMNAIQVGEDLSGAPYLQAALVAEHVGRSDEAVRRLRQGLGLSPDDPRIRAKLIEFGEVPGQHLVLPPGR